MYELIEKKNWSYLGVGWSYEIRKSILSSGSNYIVIIMREFEIYSIRHYKNLKLARKRAASYVM